MVKIYILIFSIITQSLSSITLTTKLVNEEKIDGIIKEYGKLPLLMVDT
jgi:hypothetical protein